MARTVSEIMTSETITHTVPSTVAEIIKILIRKNITGLPITDNNGKYVGIISRRDIFDNPNETQTAMVMRKAKAVNQKDSIDIAAREMFRQHRRHLAVVDDEEKVTGILTPQNFLPVIRERYGDVLIRKILDDMTVPIWNMSPLNVVRFTMKLTKVYACPVINLKGDFVGLVTDRDLFDKVDLRSQLVLSEAGIADDEDPWSWGGIRNVVTYMIERNNLELPDIPVEDIMVKDPKVVYTNDKLSVAVKNMETGNFNQLPVLEGHDRLIGMLFDIKILSVFL